MSPQTRPVLAEANAWKPIECKAVGLILSQYLIVETDKFTNGRLRQITHSHVLFDKGDLKLKTMIGAGCEFIIEL